MNFFKPNLNAIQADAIIAAQSASQQQNKDDIWVSLDEGSNTIRILPPWSQEGKLFKKTAKHGDLPPNKESHVCLDVAFPQLGLKCPICSTLDQYKNTLKMHWAWKPYIKMYANVIKKTYNPATGQTVIKQGVLGFTKMVYDLIIMYIANPQVGDVSDPYTGVDLIITKTKKGDKTSYSVSSIPARSKIVDDDNIIQKILTDIKDLDTIFKQPDQEIYDKICKCATGLDNHFKYLTATTNNYNAPANTAVQQVNLQNSYGFNCNIQSTSNTAVPNVQSAPAQHQSNFPTDVPFTPAHEVPSVLKGVLNNNNNNSSTLQQSNNNNIAINQPTGMLVSTQQQNDKPQCFGTFVGKSQCLACKVDIECQRAQQQKK